jgi:hypothetical protein
VHCSITIAWSLVGSKLSIKLILSESPIFLRKFPASTTDFGQLVLVDLDVGKLVTRTAFGFTLCREESNLEISASETDVWSSLLGSYFSLKSKVLLQWWLLKSKYTGIPQMLKQIYSYCFNR